MSEKPTTVYAAMINEYIARFAKDADSTIPPLDADGYTTLKRGSADIGINCYENIGMLLVMAPVMKVPAARREALYRRLLEVSFTSTYEAAFAIDSESDMICVRALRHMTGLDYEEFTELVHRVATVADEWDDTLKAEFPA